MVQRVEELAAQHHSDSLVNCETLANAGVQVPIAGALEDVAAEAELSGAGIHEGIGILVEDRADHARLILQLRLRQFHAGLERGARLRREVGGQDSGADGERLA